MNTLEKIYCRAFQTCFKIALPLLPYRTPKVLGSIKKIPAILEDFAYDTVLVIADPTITMIGLTDRVTSILRASNIRYAVYDNTVANPTTTNVEEAREIYIKHKCDCIIAIGGGSSIDCAKAVGARIARPKKKCGDMAGILKVNWGVPLIIAIPTTAGTGSEATLAAVITDAETRHKYAINSFPLIPKYAVLDPRLTLSLPPFVTATTGMDALTHAVEAYIGGETTHGTRVDAIMAVKLIFENLYDAYEDGYNLKARRGMLNASYYAGCAFTRSYVGYVHAVAHTLGGEYNVPHGLANAVLLPFVLEEYGPAIYGKLKKLAIAAGLAKITTPKKKAALKFIQAIKDMKETFGIGDTIRQIKEEDIPRLSKLAAKEANPLYPVPVLMGAKELEKFYYMLMEVK